jgi:hypothetical protein
MAYHLFIEFVGEPAWAELASSVRGAGVEAVPMPAQAEQETHALAISIPFKVATLSTWALLEPLLFGFLQGGATIWDLYQGQPVVSHAFSDLRSRLLTRT